MNTEFVVVCLCLGDDVWCYGNVTAAIILKIGARCGRPDGHAFVGLGRAHGLEMDAFVLNADFDAVALHKVAREDLLGDGSFQLALHRAFERARTVLGVVPDVRDKVKRGIIGRQRHFLVREALAHFLNLQLHNLAQLAAPERVEDDKFIQPVEEFRAESVAHGVHHARLHRLVLRRVHRLLEDQIRADIRRQDDDCVGEVDGAALRIGDSAVVQHLQ
mmetsp:Transcript_2996/g.6454  ORF Transcript_2996/g.6454 Transcript_2996/m.6454 type:complete len:218 (-) Transcript_2996:337-990(-)